MSMSNAKTKMGITDSSDIEERGTVNTKDIIDMKVSTKPMSDAKTTAPSPKSIERAATSALTSTLQNQDSRDSGRRNALAVHYSGKNGPWGVQLQATRQDMSPENPGRDKLVSFGSFDGTFNVAAKGNLYVADLSYDIPGSLGWLSGVKVYGNYSLFDKDESSFEDSQRFILGTSFSLKDLWIAVEWLHGKHDP